MLDERLRKLKEEFMAKAALQPPGKQRFLRRGESSLHDIIRTKEQADRFMRQFYWLREERKREEALEAAKNSVS